MSMLAPPPVPTPPPPPAPGESQIRQWHMWCHLSALSMYVIPFGSVLGPLLIWQIKKNEMPSIESHGKAAVNFHLTILIILAIAVVVMFVTCVGLVLLPFLALVPLASNILSIIAGIKANDGKPFTYPCSMKFLS